MLNSSCICGRFRLKVFSKSWEVMFIILKCWNRYRRVYPADITWIAQVTFEPCLFIFMPTINRTDLTRRRSYVVCFFFLWTQYRTCKLGIIKRMILWLGEPHYYHSRVTTFWCLCRTRAPTPINVLYWATKSKYPSGALNWIGEPLYIIVSTMLHVKWLNLNQQS